MRSGQELVRMSPPLSFSSFLLAPITDPYTFSVIFVRFCRSKRRRTRWTDEIHRGVSPPFIVHASHARGVLRNGIEKESDGHTRDVLSSLQISLGY
ncbi:unnamed protein product [Victoria cruziana]